MKKYLWLLLVGAASLTACGDDDDPVIPELNKLTKVSCYKNGDTSPLFTAEIDYTTTGSIQSMHISGDKELRFFFSDGKFLVMDIASGTEVEEYTLSGSVITAKKVSKKNAYASNEVYVSDEYTYRYTGSNLIQTSWLTRWPKKDGQGYESEGYDDYDKFTWVNGNVATFTRNQDRMEYEYSVAENPKNFPLRVIGSFAPVGFDAVTPLNLLYGAQNRNLPTRAYTYTIPNPGQVKAEYRYTYTTVGDYITGMTIDENNSLASGNEGGANTYKYTFEYNYAVK